VQVVEHSGAKHKKAFQKNYFGIKYEKVKKY
jgi:hypothetical protein